MVAILFLFWLAAFCIHYSPCLTVLSFTFNSNSILVPFVSLYFPSVLNFTSMEKNRYLLQQQRDGVWMDIHGLEVFSCYMLLNRRMSSQLNFRDNWITQLHNCVHLYTGIQLLKPRSLRNLYWKYTLTCRIQEQRFIFQHIQTLNRFCFIGLQQGKLPFLFCSSLIHDIKQSSESSFLWFSPPPEFGFLNLLFTKFRQLKSLIFPTLHPSASFAIFWRCLSVNIFS